MRTWEDWIEERKEHSSKSKEAIELLKKKIQEDKKKNRK